jgi:hypothetical protein
VHLAADYSQSFHAGALRSSCSMSLLEGGAYFLEGGGAAARLVEGLCAVEGGLHCGGFFVAVPCVSNGTKASVVLMGGLMVR